MEEVCQFRVARVRVKLLCPTQLAHRGFNLPPFVLAELNEITGHVNLSQLRIEPFRDAKFPFGLFDQCGIIFLKHRYPGHRHIQAEREPAHMSDPAQSLFLKRSTARSDSERVLRSGPNITRVIHGLRVIVVGFQVRGMAFGEPPLPRRAEREPQTPSHLLRYFVLDGEDVG